MSRQLNEKMIGHVVSFVGTSSDFVFLDHSGLDAIGNVALRREMRKRGVRVLAAKVSFARNALRRAVGTGELRTVSGALAIATGGDDVVALCKAVKAALSGYDQVRVLGGICEGREIAADDVVALSQSKGRTEMLAEIAGVVESVGSRLVAVIGAPACEVAAACDADRV